MDYLNIYGGGGILLLYLASVCYKAFMPMITQRTALPAALNNQLPAFFSYFLGGMAFVFYWETLKSRLGVLVAPSLCSCILFSCVSIPFLSELVMPIALSVVVMWIGFRARSLQRISIDRDYSYGVYLVHYPLIMCLVDCGVFQSHWWLGLSLVIGASFFCACILEKVQFFFSKKH